MRYARTLRQGRMALVLAMLAVLVFLAACNGATGAPQTTAAVSRTTPTAASTVYVAVGASDARGVGASDPNKTAYVPLLISRLPKDSSALNLGVNGYTVHDALVNELPQALAAHPTLVTVWLVGNDFRQCTPLSDYQRDLDSLLGQLESQTHAQVFVANVPDMSLLPAIRSGAGNLAACLHGQQPAQIRALAQQWNAAIGAVVAKHHDVLVDLFHSDLASHPEYVSGDGFHPSDAGYRVLADLFWRQITAHHAVATT